MSEQETNETATKVETNKGASPLDELRNGLEDAKTYLGNRVYQSMGSDLHASNAYSTVLKALAWFDDYCTAKSAEITR